MLPSSLRDRLKWLWRWPVIFAVSVRGKRAEKGLWRACREAWSLAWFPVLYRPLIKRRKPGPGPRAWEGWPGVWQWVSRRMVRERRRRVPDVYRRRGRRAKA